MSKLFSIEQISNDIGAKILMSPVDLCEEDTCWEGGCTNVLITRPEAITVNTKGTAVVGVQSYVETRCECAGDMYDVPVNPQRCTDVTCLNGGTCRETWGDVQWV